MGAEGVSMDQHLAAFVAEEEGKSATMFGGSFSTVCLTAISATLVGLTFGYHVGKPLLEAYAKTRCVPSD